MGFYNINKAGFSSFKWWEIPNARVTLQTIRFGNWKKREARPLHLMYIAWFFLQSKPRWSSREPKSLSLLQQLICLASHYFSSKQAKSKQTARQTDRQAGRQATRGAVGGRSWSRTGLTNLFHFLSFFLFDNSQPKNRCPLGPEKKCAAYLSWCS